MFLYEKTTCLNLLVKSESDFTPYNTKTIKIKISVGLITESKPVTKPIHKK